MANAFSTPPVLPDPLLDYLPGLIIKAPEIEEIYETLNYAIAEQHAEQVINQTFENEICYTDQVTFPVDGEDNPIPICEWDVPLISDKHTILNIYIRGYYTAAGNSGTIMFTSKGSGTFDIMLLPLEGEPEADDFSLQGTLDLADLGEGFDTITLEMIVGNAAGKAVITQVYAEIEPLASPLATSSHSGAVPFGTQVLSGPDYALPSSRAYQLIDTITTLNERNRVFMNASAINEAYNDELPSLDFSDEVGQMWACLLEDSRGSVQYIIHYMKGLIDDKGPVFSSFRLLSSEQRVATNQADETAFRLVRRLFYLPPDFSKKYLMWGY